jgi:hypothetical protein
MDLRAITPAWSTTQSQHESRADSDEPSSSSTGTATPQVESPPQLASLADPDLDELVPELDDTMIDADDFDDDLPPAQPKDADNLHALLKYDRSHPHAPPWTKLATIQHSNLVQFKFRYCTIPEDLGPLRQLLSCTNTSKDLAVRAGVILSMFEGHTSFPTSVSAIAQLAELWVEDAAIVTGSATEPPPSKPVQAILIFNTYFDIESWQITRLLDCFVCSQTAWNLLLQVHQYENPPAHDPWMSDQRVDLCEYVQPLKFLNGKDSTTAAMLKLDMLLCAPKSHDLSHSGLTWKEPPNNPGDDWFFRKELLFHTEHHLQSSYCATKRLPLPLTPSSPLWLYSPHSIPGEHSAILLRKPPTWSDCPSYCLAVFDPVIDFANERQLGRMLDQVLLAKDIYVVADGARKPGTFDDADFRACKMWSDILAGRNSSEELWPAS